MIESEVDVLVVGAGNAAACAALAARETGASVAMLEAAPEEERGGNSTYTAGAMRVVFHFLSGRCVMSPQEEAVEALARPQGKAFLSEVALIGDYALARTGEGRCTIV